MNTGRFTRERTIGSKNPNWRGDNVGYFALHTWLQRNYGKAEKCIDCGSIKTVQWANISGMYKRDIKDWKQLCVVCHKAFDGKTKLSKEQAKEIRSRNTKGELQKDLAKEFQVDQGTISNIMRNKIQFYV